MTNADNTDEQPRYKSKRSHDQQLTLHSQFSKDKDSFLQYASRTFAYYLEEKVWRLDISRQLQSYVSASVEEQKQQLDLKHSREDIKMFSLTKVSYLEEDIF